PEAPERPPTRLIASGGGVGYRGFWINGNHHYRDGSGPGALYSTVRAPQGQPRLLYLALFKYPSQCERFDCPWDAGIASQGDGNLTVVDGLRVNDQELVIRVKLFADVGSGKVTREELRVAGQRLDLSRGRLVLLDFTRDRARS